jgi:hypothetical protein
MKACLADAPATYQIRVHGRLAPLTASRLGDFALAVRQGDAQTEVTDITGWISDQAALMGVLELLYSMGLTLLSVERLQQGEDESATRTQAACP